MINLDLSDRIAHDAIEDDAYWAALLADDERQYQEEGAQPTEMPAWAGVCAFECPIPQYQQEAINAVWENRWDAWVNR